MILFLVIPVLVILRFLYPSSEILKEEETRTREQAHLRRRIYRTVPLLEITYCLYCTIECESINQSINHHLTSIFDPRLTHSPTHSAYYSASTVQVQVQPTQTAEQSRIDRSSFIENKTNDALIVVVWTCRSSPFAGKSSSLYCWYVSWS